MGVAEGPRDAKGEAEGGDWGRRCDEDENGMQSGKAKIESARVIPSPFFRIYRFGPLPGVGHPQSCHW